MSPPTPPSTLDVAGLNPVTSPGLSPLSRTEHPASMAVPLQGPGQAWGLGGGRGGGGVPSRTHTAKP